jgi:hypothetical protein
MHRRRALGALAAAAVGATAGCLGFLGEESVQVRVMRPSEGHAANAERHCVVESSFVADHPVLERVLDAAANAPRKEWVSTDVDRSAGESLAADLRAHCEAVGGVYHYDGGNYVVRVGGEGETLFPRDSGGSEAIRGPPSQ